MERWESLSPPYGRFGYLWLDLKWSEIIKTPTIRGRKPPNNSKQLTPGSDDSQDSGTVFHVPGEVVLWCNLSLLIRPGHQGHEFFRKRLQMQLEEHYQRGGIHLGTRKKRQQGVNLFPEVGWILVPLISPCHGFANMAPCQHCKVNF